MGVHTVHEQVQPLEEEFRIRTHVDKVCSLWPLNLDWDVQIFLHFRFAVFLKIRFVFLSNQHFMISKKVQSNLGPLELVANLATRWRHLPSWENFATIWCLIQCLHILVTRWSYLHWLQIWPLAYCCKLAQLALVQNLDMRWPHLHWF